MKNFGNITADEFSELQNEKNGEIIDVRTKDEFNEGHLKGAQNINIYSPDFTLLIDELDREKPYFVYCAAGGRSATAMMIMEEMGFNEVYNLDGGIKAWKNNGNEIVK